MTMPSLGARERAGDAGRGGEEVRCGVLAGVAFASPSNERRVLN